MRSLPAGCTVMHSRCSVAGDLLVDVHPAGGVKSSGIHSNPQKTCIKLTGAAVIFPRRYPSAALLNRLSLPCRFTSTP